MKTENKIMREDWGFKTVCLKAIICSSLVKLRKQ